MKYTHRLLAIVICLLAASPALAMRCESGLVDVGDHKAEVLTRCGVPVAKTLVAVETTVQKTDGAVVREAPVERWTYHQGPKTLMQTLTFRGDVLTRIEAGDRVSVPGGNSVRLLASIGNTMAEVRAKNGEPDFVDLVGTETKAKNSKGTVTRVEVPVERWGYRFGPGRFMQILTFKGGRLARIETGDRE